MKASAEFSSICHIYLCPSNDNGQTCMELQLTDFQPMTGQVRETLSVATDGFVYCNRVVKFTGPRSAVSSASDSRAISLGFDIWSSIVSYWQKYVH